MIVPVYGSRKNTRTLVINKQNILLAWTIAPDIMAHNVLQFLLQAPVSPSLEQAFDLHHPFWTQMLDYSCTLMQKDSYDSYDAKQKN